MGLNTRRTLRVLKALALGLPILSDQFIFDSLCSDHWLRMKDYRHPRYAKFVVGERSPAFAGDSVCVLRCTRPRRVDVWHILRAADAKIVRDVRQACDYLVVGSEKDAHDWCEKRLYRAKRGDTDMRDQLRALKALSGTTEIVTSKVSDFLSSSLSACIDWHSLVVYFQLLRRTTESSTSAHSRGGSAMVCPSIVLPGLGRDGER